MNRRRPVGSGRVACVCRFVAGTASRAEPSAAVIPSETVTLAEALVASERVTRAKALVPSERVRPPKRVVSVIMSALVDSAALPVPVPQRGRARRSGKAPESIDGSRAAR
jgi:hypothetical protein